MALKPHAKRPAHADQRPSKRRKVSKAKDTQAAPGNKRSAAKTKGKEKASERSTIPIPDIQDDEEAELSEEDLDLLEEYGSAVTFLSRLDQKGIARSKKETERLHRMQKPVRAPVADDLPSIDSDDEEGEDEEVNWSSGIESDSEVFDEDEVPESDAESIASGSSHPAPRRNKKSNVDEEMPYENLPRKRRPSWEPESDKDEGIERLPIKLANGRVQKTSEKVHIVKGRQEREPSDDESEDDVPEQLPTSRIEDVSTGARFGRPAVVDVIGNKSRKARIQGAKEQIASICQEIVADPETSIGLLRRLHTFSLLEISTPSHPEPVPNDVVIRRLTILSQLSVFKDIIPGYRIRALTDKEKAEKVSQMVQRTRDWEQGLVGVYQLYLRTLEAEVKAKSELAETALYCMCTLLVELTHFNFRVNLMNCIVANLSRKSWDKTSDLCLNSIIKVFRADNTGVPSLELVRILNRMVKERMFNVHPEVLSCLLHLRLKTELGVRASETKADKEEANKAHKGRRGKGKGKAKSEHVHLSKKAKKVLQERKEIEKEMREAEAEVDKEERAVTQTETLKLLFVLYFRILKNPHPTPLLPAALQGISKFSHLVNIDFFKDLLKVLKELMARQSEDDEDASLHLEHGSPDTRDVQHQLLCIVTAFELLSGQGEALDIDLTDFINWLYTILPSLALMPDLETAPTSAFKSDVRVSKPQSTADMLFRALDLVFIPRTSASAPPPWRSAAFAKRLLACALHWSPATAARAMDFVGALVERDSKLGALLSTEDRSVNGVYRPDLDDPQLSNPFGTSFWELLLLSRTHWVAGVVDHARKLLATTS